MFSPKWPLAMHRKLNGNFCQTILYWQIQVYTALSWCLVQTCVSSIMHCHCSTYIVIHYTVLHAFSNNINVQPDVSHFNNIYTDIITKKWSKSGPPLCLVKSSLMFRFQPSNGSMERGLIVLITLCHKHLAHKSFDSVGLTSPSWQSIWRPQPTHFTCILQYLHCTGNDSVTPPTHE
jgi:hypothetical protein